MGSIYRTQSHGDVGQRIYDVAQRLLRPRMVEDIILGFGTASGEPNASEGVVIVSGRSYIIRIEEVHIELDFPEPAPRETVAIAVIKDSVEWDRARLKDYGGSEDACMRQAEEWVARCRREDPDATMVIRPVFAGAPDPMRD